LKHFVVIMDKTSVIEARRGVKHAPAFNKYCKGIQPAKMPHPLRYAIRRYFNIPDKSGEFLFPGDTPEDRNNLMIYRASYAGHIYKIFEAEDYTKFQTMGLTLLPAFNFVRDFSHDIFHISERPGIRPDLAGFGSKAIEDAISKMDVAIRETNATIHDETKAAVDTIRIQIEKMLPAIK